jgi:hypothetical protein
MATDACGMSELYFETGSEIDRRTNDPPRAHRNRERNVKSTDYASPGRAPIDPHSP